MYYKRPLPRPTRRDGSSAIKEEEEHEHLLQRGPADDCHHQQQQPAEETENEQSILLTNMSFESEKAAAAAAATTTQQPDNDRDVEQHDVAMGPSEANNINNNKIGDGGARQAELMELAWGKHGRWWIFFGLAVCMIAYQLDNTTFLTYYTYALSDFKNVSASASLAVAYDLVFALSKPFWAKSSDIYGRGEIYPVALALLIVGLVTAASATSFGVLATGTFIKVLGMTCINSLNDVIVSDFTTTRQRGFGINFLFWPFLVLPWVSGSIVDSVMKEGGLGWHWGIGIDAIVYPIGVSVLMTILLVFQRRAKKLAIASRVAPARPRPSFREVCSALDLGGLFLTVVSLGFILVPVSLASLQPRRYATPWIIALLVLGPIGLLFVVPFYELRVAKTPFFPPRYLKHRTICLAFLLYFLDFMAAATGHGYLFNWALIAQNMSILQATYLFYMNGVTIVFVGLAFGFIMWKTRHYKWWIMLGCVFRLIGYAMMFRIRTETNPPYAELYLAQVVQGLGDGLVQTGGFVATTVNVPHSEVAQMTALTVLVGILGQSVGTAIAGAIYTGTFREELWKQLGDSATYELVDSVFNSITTDIPAWGTADRHAINKAYNHVTSYFFVAAMVIIVPGFFLVYFLPNQKLTDGQNLVEQHGILGENVPEIQEGTRSEKRAE